MTTHEPNRQVSEDEQLLWAALNDHLEQTDRDYVSITQVASNKTRLHEARSRQIVATWENEGLVTSESSKNMGMLTEYGRQVEDIESGMVSGESWR